MGSHIEYYQTGSSTYVRLSQSRRHNYTLVIDPATLVATPELPEQKLAREYLPVIV